MTDWVTIDDLVGDSQDLDQDENSRSADHRFRVALEEENLRLQQQVAALQDSSSGSSTDFIDVSQEIDQEQAQAELQAVEKEIQELKESLAKGATGLFISKDDAEDSASDLEAGRNAEKLKNLQGQVTLRMKGLDICILVDCTGSMGWCINAVKGKIRNIINEILAAHTGANVRLAFVGYRDYNTRGYPNGKHEVQDFLGIDDLARYVHFVDGVLPISNADGCEDVVGGLQNVLKLSWRSSTRLVIHFGDCPCHGTKYHDLGGDRGWDAYPDGDPKGLVLEDLMQRLCDQRVDYYFAAITHHTVKMTQAMQECYAHSHNAQFNVMDWKDESSSFVPLILNSVSSSLQRSAQYNKMLASADGKLSGQTKDVKSVFHSTVG